MTLPRIANYALPAGSELPAARVPWEVDPSRAALLIHDMQNYFVNAFGPGGSPIEDVIANIVALRRRCDELAMPVFYSAQPGHQDPAERGLQTDFWGPGMTSAPEHREIVAALTPDPWHRRLTKWRYSAFRRTPLEAELQADRRDQLIVTGIYASIGCALTAADAFMSDIQPFFVADAVADFSRERHDLAVSFVAERCGVAMTTAHVLAALQPQGAWAR